MFGPALGVIEDAHPVVNEEDAGAGFGVGIIVGEEALQGGVAGFVFDYLGFDLCVKSGSDHGQGKEEWNEGAGFHEVKVIGTEGYRKWGGGWTGE